MPRVRPRHRCLVFPRAEESAREVVIRVGVAAYLRQGRHLNLIADANCHDPPDSD